MTAEAMSTHYLKLQYGSLATSSLDALRFSESSFSFYFTGNAMALFLERVYGLSSWRLEDHDSPAETCK